MNIKKTVAYGWKERQKEEKIQTIFRLLDVFVQIIVA